MEGLASLSMPRRSVLVPVVPARFCVKPKTPDPVAGPYSEPATPFSTSMRSNCSVG